MASDRWETLLRQQIAVAPLSYYFGYRGSARGRIGTRTMAQGPDFKEIEKDIKEYLQKKYGVQVQLAGFRQFPEAAGHGGEDRAGQKPKEPPSIRFDMKPEQLKGYLDEYLVKQDEAKEVLATKICTHFNRIKRFELGPNRRRTDAVGAIKNNIIMIGPTGVGKTYLVKLIAHRIGVPFVKGDATKFSETGYVGADVEDLVRELVHEADGDIELAQYGIIYLDEVDKIASTSNLVGPDVSRGGVQRTLLKPMEEAEVELRVPHDPISQMEAMIQFQKSGKRERRKINTRNILFIMSGAFYGLEDIVKRRLNRQGIGFGAEIHSRDERLQLLKQVKAEDLISYGFESEFVGRLPVITVFEHLEIEDLYNILLNPKSPIMASKKRDFKAYGVDLQVEDEALRMIAAEAHEAKTGARGLTTALERVLIKFEHVLPSTSIRHLVVSPAVVENPQRELEKILEHPNDPQREAVYQRLSSKELATLSESLRKNRNAYRQRTGMELSDARVDLIIRRTAEQRLDLEEVIEDVGRIHRAVRDFEQEFFGRSQFGLTFSEEAVDRLARKVWSEGMEPAEYLERSFENYEHGLRLLKEKTGKAQFSLPPEALDDPEGTLNALIRGAYHGERA
jgi:endopeptidase Clp ATP-binding regulatory subunit ClpX